MIVSDGRIAGTSRKPHFLVKLLNNFLVKLLNNFGKAWVIAPTYQQAAQLAANAHGRQPVLKIGSFP